MAWLKVGDLRCSSNSIEFLRIHIWLIPLLEKTVSHYFWRPCFICVSSFVRRKDRDLVEHLDKPAMNMCLYGFLCIVGIQYMYVKSSSSCLYTKWNEDRFVVFQHIWCRQIREIVCRVPREWVKSKFLWQDADVMSLADKRIVVGCLVCRDYDKILMETGKLSDNIRVTEMDSCLVLTECLRRGILRFLRQNMYNFHARFPFITSFQEELCHFLVTIAFNLI